MRILHYLSELKADDLTTSYVSLLVSATKESAEVGVLTQKERADKRLKEFSPDILHIHACWNREAASVAATAREQGVAVVISPHGGLMPYTMRHEQPTEKLLKRITFQKTMLEAAEGVLATSREEGESLRKLGWQDRIGIVPSAILDSTITATEMAAAILKFYTKVIDTRYRRLMTSSEREAVCSLLRIGTAPDTDNAPIAGDRMRTLRTLNAAQWQRVMLLCHDEDIRHLADKATAHLLLHVPNINIAEIDRFPTPLKKARGPLATDHLLDQNKERSQQLARLTAKEPLLRRIFTAIENIQYHHRHNELSLHHLADMFALLRYEDYDEDRFDYIARTMSSYKQAGRVLQVLATYFNLEEGFMPIMPCNDKATQRIIDQMDFRP
jgi:hypothetical protein